MPKKATTCNCGCHCGYRGHGAILGLFLILIGLLIYYGLTLDMIIIIVGVLAVIKGLIMKFKGGYGCACCGTRN